MTASEIFQKVSEQQIKGVMVHDYMVDYFNFLNLHGYKRMSEYHACKEMKAFRKIHRYYIDHYERLIPDLTFERVEIIPAKWYEHKRSDVDINTKRNAVKEAFEKWAAWENETKTLYHSLYKELMEAGDVTGALKVGELAQDVEDELKWIHRKQLDLAAVDYSMAYILDEQDYYHDFYKKKEH